MVGGGLSGEQKHRIAIGISLRQCFLMRPTSALDADSDLIVQQALDKMVSNRTTIVVAHGLSTIRDVIVLKKGLVVDSGSHMDLISKKG
ncbi:hypothetical protein F3Y22_tig00110163pilonHSYRG00210 [Hibiscus syriacus]|uniref:ABC transporter domain-containing protein n=1 Tax=Hibiscus syriacus TaxID=106335 RepID=A0A6A3BFQ6_HIBSY|nr:hypothetical protein F3Y22_tig00110163pilonHSYRG00210 [Hibiscus syriacus]